MCKCRYFEFVHDLYGAGWFMLNAINDELQFTLQHSFLNKLDDVTTTEHILERCDRYV